MYLQKIDYIDSTSPVASLLKSSLKSWENFLKKNSIQIIVNNQYSEKLFFKRMLKNKKLYAIWSFLCIPDNSEMTAGEAIGLYLEEFGYSYDHFSKKYERDSTFRRYFNSICPH